MIPTDQLTAPVRAAGNVADPASGTQLPQVRDVVVEGTGTDPISLAIAVTHNMIRCAIIGRSGHVGRALDGNSGCSPVPWDQTARARGDQSRIWVCLAG